MVDAYELLDFADYPDDPDREALLLALARGDGQPWQSMAEASRHTAEMMYGKQADALEPLLHDWFARKRRDGAVEALRSVAADDNWADERGSWDGADVKAWLISDAYLVERGEIQRTDLVF